MSLLADRRVRCSISGSLEAVRNVRARRSQGRGVIALHRGRLQGRRAERRGGARIIILPPAVNLAGDAQAMRIRVVRRYLKESDREREPRGMPGDKQIGKKREININLISIGPLA